MKLSVFTKYFTGIKKNIVVYKNINKSKSNVYIKIMNF